MFIGRKGGFQAENSFSVSSVEVTPVSEKTVMSKVFIFAIRMQSNIPARYNQAWVMNKIDFFIFLIDDINIRCFSERVFAGQ